MSLSLLDFYTADILDNIVYMYLICFFSLVDFVKDDEELYDTTNQHYKDKGRKECLLERFASCHKLSVKVWFESQRTHYGKLAQYKSGQAPKEITGRTVFRINLTD